MTNITNIDSVTFEIDGIQYQKNFISLVAGNNLRIVDVYDVKLELASFDNYANYTVNGNTYNNVADLQEALLPVLFTRASLNGVTIDGDIINVELVNDTLTFTLSDGSTVNILLPYVRSVTGTAVNNSDPRNVVVDKYPNVTSVFPLDLSSATLSNNLIDVAVTAINSQSPFVINDGEQAVFFFDVIYGEFARRFYFRETTGVSTIVSVSNDTIIADGDTSFKTKDYLIDLGDIGSQSIEDGFNTNPNEPFTISGLTFITAIQNSTTKIWYWDGGEGDFGDTGANGPATANNFILLKDDSAIESVFLVAAKNLYDLKDTEQAVINLGLENAFISDGGNIIGANANYSYILGGNNNLINANNSAPGEANGVAILSGIANTIKADFDGDMQGSLISGGQENILDGYWNFIGAGKGNEINGDITNYCVIPGGNRNLITGAQAFLSFIGGGRDNIITSANGNRNIIVGGGENKITGDQASRVFIGGGELNQVTGLNSFYVVMGGGQLNQITGQNSGYSFLGGGKSNQIIGSTTTYSFLGGGENNQINANSSSHVFLGGGRQNIFENNSIYSVITGGYLNKMNGQRSFIGGGFGNEILSTSGTQNFLGGGNSNKMLSTNISNSFIGCGIGNEIGILGNGTSLTGVSILGGEDGSAIASRSTILGGLGLDANSYLEVVKGTYNDSSNPDGIGTPSKTVYVSNQIAESLGIGTDDANRANAYVWLKNGIQIRYNTPIYPDNATASASEIVGTVYRTATGQLMEVY